jgi:MGT family glycosyltransferase
MRVLAYTSPARGHLYPVQPILSTLTARGHKSSIYTLSVELAHLPPHIEGYPIDPAIERNQLVDWHERTPPRAVASTLRTLAQRAARDAPDLARAIERCQPDVLLIDVNCWGAAVVAEASGLPWALYCPYLLPLPSREVPAYGPGLAPLAGPLGALRDALVRRLVLRGFDRAAMPVLNGLRSRYGLPALACFMDTLARPELLLALTAEGFEYPRSHWPANVRFVGPMHWSPPQPAPPWLGELADPLVLVTCSTERQRDKRLLQVALAALPPAGISVIGTAAAHEPSEFAVPSGSRVVGFAAHEPLLERAACVVCHGGMGITQKALAAGVPVVVVPFGRDQMETARRVEFARAGVRLPLRRLSPERLAAAVRVAIDCREGAQRVSRAYEAAGGPAAAADAIEALGGGNCR